MKRTALPNILMDILIVLVHALGWEGNQLDIRDSALSGFVLSWIHSIAAGYFNMKYEAA